MERKYKDAREKLGITLQEIADRVNEDLGPDKRQLTLPTLFRMEEGLRQRMDDRYYAAMKYYRRIYAHYKRQQDIQAINEKYGG